MTITYKAWMARAAAVLSLALPASIPASANPEGGQVRGGQATIEQPNPANTIIRQGTDKAIIDWQSFSIGAGEKTQFIQPNSGSVALNRVVGQDPSRILGELIANGKIIVMNPNGLTVGPSGKINAHSFIATTSDISNDDFMAGRLNFDKPGNSQARVINEGTVTAAEAGMVAFVAPSVKNSGVITARLGKIALAAGNKFVIDFYGDDLVSFAVGAEVVERITGADGQEVEALIEAGGRMEAQTIVMSARAAREIVNTVISVSGDVAARTVTRDGGVIRLSGGENGAVKVTGTLDASGANGGTISMTGNAVHAGGTIKAEGPGGGQRSASGGSITIDGKTFASADGKISADGVTGGNITVKSGNNAAVNGTLSAKGSGGQGGTVTVTAPGETWEADGAVIDVSGATGGTITNIAGKKLVTSARYIARGTWGDGGVIDVTAKDMFLFSSTFDASGMRHGGTVRLGGEYQGGKGLAVDLIPNAKTLAATDGVRIDVSSLGRHGHGGTAIIWGDDKAVFLGFADSRPGTHSGTGGLVEASSLGTLTWRGTIETARNGQRGGTLLLDPKNIIVADAAYSQLNLILGAFQNNDAVQAEPLEAFDYFGTSLALHGTLLAVGAPGDDGADDSCLDCGAVYLFSFADLAFNGGRLAGRIGSGYSGAGNIELGLSTYGSEDNADNFGQSVSLTTLGGKTVLAAGAIGDDGESGTCSDCGAVYTFLFNGPNFADGNTLGRIGQGYTGTSDVNVAGLELGDGFGAGVALDGRRLAVGAPGDDGVSEYYYTDCFDCGAVYLFGFATDDLTGGVLEARIGDGYTGAKDIDLSGTLDDFDSFGTSVSLRGTRLAVGVPGDDGVTNMCDECGAVQLFTFADTAFNGGALVGTIGSGYVGGSSLSMGGLAEGDLFGESVSLDGSRLAVGAPADFGSDGDCSFCGAVYLFSFGENPFLAPALEAVIGDGYTGGKNVSMNGALGNENYFGEAVSLDGNRLAVGTPGDTGGEGCDGSCDFGAVFLFTFADDAFSGGETVGRIGAGGHLGGNHINLAGLIEEDDKFGISLSLEGRRLAVGSLYDDGAAGDCGFCGAVYLFTFTDDAFGGGALAGTIGHGYTGPKDIDLSASLEFGDFFGRSVSLDGNRLAVGADLDDGAANVCTDCGAVYLFAFTTPEFAGGALAGRVGAGYNGATDIDLSGFLDLDDHFGISVALSGTNMAVGAEFDDGFDDVCGNCGAAYLLTYTNLAFNGGTVVGQIGAGYNGSHDIDLGAQLVAGDLFGVSVSLDGTNLAIGSLDDGAADDCFDCGAVYLFNFSGSGFTGGALAGIAGAGYVGANDLDLTAFLAPADLFGYSISLDGGRIAIGAFGDDGKDDNCFNCGAAFLFSLAGEGFSGAALEASIGGYYEGGNNIDSVPFAGFGNAFGFAVALDGNRLAVSALDEDGASGSCTNCGAVHLFTFSDEDFNNGRHVGTIGAGYVNTLIDLRQHLDTGDAFGTAVALDGLQLGVGVAGDDGADDSCFDCGAVNLFTFTDELFNGGKLLSRIGHGYSGPNDQNIAGKLSFNDAFGSAVALDGNRLAVGAPGDDGAVNDCTDCGAAYLFTFTDAQFNGGILEAQIGFGYTGGKNIDVPGLDAGDRGGAGLALRGNVLAVSAPGDDGETGECEDCGAVGLFTFTDSNFSGGVKIGTIGAGYTGASSFNLDLGAFDELTAVAIDNNRIVIGAPGDDGSDGECVDCGAVYLFTFDATGGITGVNLAGIVGSGYTGGQNIDLTGLLEGGDQVGAAVALEGSTLAVGAPGVECTEIGQLACGAVGIFRFLSADGFNGGNFVSSLSDQADRPTDVEVDLDAFDRFGASVALNQGRLAIGAPGDDGGNGQCTDCGAAYLVSKGRFPGALVDTGFDDDASGTMLIETATLEALLAGGTSIALQANTDIFIYDPLNVSPIYEAGNLALQAGRSVFIAGNVNTGGGDLIVTSNDPGHVPAHRDPGKSEIWAPGFIDAGSGRIDFTLFDPPGDITVGPQTAAQITHVNYGPGNIIVNGVLNATGGGDAIILAVVDGLFINNVGAGALVPGTGRFLVYSNDWTADTRNGIVANNLYNRTWDANPPASITQSGNLFIYSEQPTVTITADDDARDYGAPNPAFTYTVSGLVNGDTAAYAFTGAPTFTTSTTATSNVGFYAGDISTSLGTLLSDVGYAFSFASGDLTIDPATLVITALNQAKDYGTAFSFLGTEFSAVGLQNSETIGSASLSSLASAATAGVAGSPYTINVSGAAGGTFDPLNYNISYVSGFFTVDPAALTVTALNQAKTYGQLFGFAGTEFSVAGLQNGESVGSATLTSAGAAGTAGVAGSPYTINISNATGGTFDAANYVISYVTGVLTVNPAVLTVTADNKTREYGDANPALTATITGFQNGETAAGLTTAPALTTAATATSNVGAYVIGVTGATAANYVFSYVAGTLTVTQAPLTVEVEDASRLAGEPNPSFNALITGFKFASDTAALVSGLSFTTTATPASAPGLYTVSSVGGAALNYFIQIRIDGMLEVLARTNTVENTVLNPEDDGGIQVCSNEDSGSVIPAADESGILAGCLPLKISSSKSGSTTRCFNSF